MKVRVFTQEFLEVVTRLGPMVMKRDSDFVVSGNLLLDVGKETFLHATDYNLYGRVRLNAEKIQVEKKGKVLVPTVVAGLIREIKDEAFELEAEAGTLKLRFQDGEVSFKVEDHDQFRPPAEHKSQHEFSISGADLATLVRRGSFAVSAEEGRYAFHAVLVEITGRRIRLVSTDGKRLAMALGELAEEMPEPVRILVPAVVLRQAVRLFEKEDQVKVQIGERIVLSTEQIHFQGNLVTGNYPEISQVFDVDRPHQIILDTKAVLGIVRRISKLVAGEGLPINLRTSNGNLEVQYSSERIAAARLEVPCEEIEGELEAFQVDPDFLATGLSMVGEKTRIRFLGRKDSFFIQDPDDETFNYVIMPIVPPEMED